MSDLNKGKVRWIIILGAPDLTSPYWEGITPHDAQCVDHWYQGMFFHPKKEAQKYSKKYSSGKYIIRIEKYSGRMKTMKKTFI